MREKTNSSSYIILGLLFLLGAALLAFLFFKVRDAIELFPSLLKDNNVNNITTYYLIFIVTLVKKKVTWF